jgi:hypothetical protein
VKELHLLEMNVDSVALVILPPPEIAEELNALRAKFDKAYLKWPAHISLFLTIPSHLLAHLEAVVKVQ